MGDDHGWEETGYNGHPHVKTPVLDEIAATGLRFDRFYAAHPSCSPTRAAFSPDAIPTAMARSAPGWSLRPEEITIAHILRKAGYQLRSLRQMARRRGQGRIAHQSRRDGISRVGVARQLLRAESLALAQRRPARGLQGESSEIVVSEAIRFIDRARQEGKPFFTIVWFGSPHEPYSGLPADLALYDDLPAKYSDKKVRLTSNETGGPVTRPQGEVLRERYAEITAMDRAIGMLAKASRRAGPAAGHAALLLRRQRHLRRRLARPRRIAA